MYDFISPAERKQNMLKNVCNQTVLVTKKKKKTDIYQNIFFYVPQKKVSHTGLERHESK